MLRHRLDDQPLPDRRSLKLFFHRRFSSSAIAFRITHSLPKSKSNICRVYNDPVNDKILLRPFSAHQNPCVRILPVEASMPLGATTTSRATIIKAVHFDRPALRQERNKCSKDPKFYKQFGPRSMLHCWAEPNDRRKAARAAWRIRGRDKYKPCLNQGRWRSLTRA